MTEAEREELGVAIGKVRESTGRRRYCKEIQVRAVKYLAEREAAGAGTSVASQELGLKEQTLRRWRKAQGEEGKRQGLEHVGSFRQVAVGAGGRWRQRGEIVVYGPHGLRIEGLAQAELVAILRALG
jgi:transposase-like protein